MKKLLFVSGLIMMSLFVFSFSGTVMAEEKATKAECIAKCQEAAKQIKEIGLEAVLKKISDKGGEFAWKDSYVFCFDKEKFLAHPVTIVVGMSISSVKDSNGKLYVEEMMKVAEANGEGWVNYMYANWKSDDPTPQPKTSYVLNVPEENVVLGAGIYE